MKVDSYHGQKWLNAGELRVPLDEIVGVRCWSSGLGVVLRGGGEQALDQTAKGPEWFQAEAAWLCRAVSGDYIALTTPSPGHRP